MRWLPRSPDPEADPQQLRLSFAEVTDAIKVYEYAVLVTSLEAEILTLAQHYRGWVRDALTIPLFLLPLTEIPRFRTLDVLNGRVGKQELRVGTCSSA